MKRADWVEQMWRVISESHSQPFVWAEHDCCLFAAKVLDAMHGTGWVDELHACYHDYTSAMQYIEAEGGVEASITRRFGEPVAGWKARRGDLVLVETVIGHGAGICTGHSIAAAGHHGLTYLPLSLGLKAWMID